MERTGFQSSPNQFLELDNAGLSIESFVWIRNILAEVHPEDLINELREAEAILSDIYTALDAGSPVPAQPTVRMCVQIYDALVSARFGKEYKASVQCRRGSGMMSIQR